MDAALLTALDHFDPTVRAQALATCASQAAPPPPAGPTRYNLHCHTFFSYNGYGSSPSRIAVEARQQGWYAAGICDFDVLDALDEFLHAGDLLGLRATANLETRVYFREYGQQVINSPGEPGIYYFMGAGFVRPPAAGSPAAAQLAQMRAGAAARTREIVDKVNAFLGEVQLDFARDVLPLTPAGNATERHVCTAYYNRSRVVLPEAAAWTAFWAARLKLPADKVAPLLTAPMDFNDVARSKLMKAGGPGYVTPTPSTFPALEEVIKLIQACDAIPMATWLDGTSAGESDMRTQLACLRAKGVAALNIIPDRNWNLKDPAERQLKIAKYHEVVAIADELELPLNIGTELNKYGQRWVDDFSAEAMAKVAPSLLRGTQVMVGHTRLLRYANYGYCGAAAQAEFGGDWAKRNRFFASVGALPAPSAETLTRLRAATPAAALALLRTAATRGQW